MIGLILAGGKSTRMGFDKGLLITNGKTWIEKTADTMSFIKKPIITSINNLQLDKYKSILPQSDFIIDNEKLDVKGPLLGILSTHVTFPDKSLFVLACDLQNMKETTLNELLEDYQSKKEYEVYLFKNKEEFEPLCAIYKSEALAKIYKKYQQGLVLKNSMKYILSLLTVSSRKIKELDLPCFQNFNTLS
jgi:molybdopterin-guanine dinucleotide biosynthesis protein A